MQYRVLGSLEVRRGDQVVDLGGYKQRALMALLVIDANSVVSTDRIIDELWGDGDGKDRQNALWTGISRLRSALEPDRPKRTDGTILVTQAPGYVLSVERADTDAGRFEALALEGRSLLETDPGAASLVLSEGLALWRGHAYEEFTYEPFATAEIERLEELRLAAVEDRIDADLRTGRSRELIGELESLVRQHPFRQRLTGHLMLALHLSGRQGDALRAFGALRTRLAEELGLDPSAALSKLEERIVLDDPTLGDSRATRALTGRDEPGLSVRGYELREQIGEGSTGHVYRAFQPAVGREVAIKVIRPELANDADFIRRFEAEAQLIASLEHPQIVPVFDYWREPDSAFLVMRRFEHGSLGDALAAGPLTTAAAVRILSQIGGALAAAHRRGVVHGDLRPANVLLDRDGNAYLTDFVMSVVPARSSVVDRADSFIAPEQRADGQATERSDLYAFGALAEFALRGAVGDGELPESPLVGPVAGIVATAMAEDPDDRFADVEAFLDAMATAFDEPPIDRDADAGEIANPYRGLRAFAERDAGQFFGRERLVERLVTRLGHAGPQGGFVALVGPSGSGKSSVVRAGLIPALRNGAIIGSERWFVASMTPGRHPFEALDDALRSIAVHPPANLLEQLTTSGISAAVESLTADPSAQTVIVVDQLEELFSHASPADANAFMAALAATAADRHSGVKVIATLRADFYDHPLRHGAFGELLRLGTEVITPMNAQELDRAITAPAEQVGVTFEPGLVALIEADMAGQSTALPLLQYALTELFDQRTGRTIHAAAYRELGGVSAVLARRADGLYNGLGEGERSAVRDVFLRLVSLDEVAADTRRRALVSELTDVAGDDVAAVLETFGRHRLLTFDRDPITRGPTVEIAHEALLTEWTRVRHWIDDARTDVQAQRRLALAAAEWADRDRQSDFLLSGARLSRYDGWLERPPVRLTTLEQDYLAGAHDASHTELRVERQRVQRLRRLVAGVGVALVLALVAGGLAFVQRQRANDEAARAEAAADEADAETAIALEESQRAAAETERADAEADRSLDAAADAEAQTAIAVAAADDAEFATLISRSAAVADDDPELGLLLALEAYQRRPQFDAEQAVLSVLSASGFESRIASWEPLVDDCIGAGVIPEGFSVAAEVALVDGRMVARDLATGEISDAGPPPADCVVGFRDESGGLAGKVDGSQIWMGVDLDTTVTFDEPTFLILETAERVAVRTDSTPTRVELLDRSSGDRVGAPTTGGQFLSSWAVSADQSVMAVGFGESNNEIDGTLVVVDPSTGAEILRRDLPRWPSTLAFDPTTGDLIAALNGGVVIRIDPLTGEFLDEFATGQVGGFVGGGFLPDGRLALVARDSITVFDPVTNVGTVAAELQNVALGIVRPDGVIVTIADQSRRDVYDLGRSALIPHAWEADASSAVIARDGRATVVNRLGDQIEIIDLTSGERTRIDGLSLPDGTTFIPRFMSPEPDGFWALSEDLVLGRWVDGALVDVLEVGSAPDIGWFPYGNQHSGARFGDYLAVPGVSQDATGEVPVEATEATLVDLSGDEPEVALRVEVPTFWAHPTADGGIFAVDRSGMLRTFDATGELVGDPIQTNADPYAMTLSDDGRILAMGTLGDGAAFENGQVLYVDVTTGEVVVIPVDGLVSTLGITPDGSQIVLAMFDGTVRLYDVEENNVPTVVYDGSGAFTNQPGWHDEAAGTMWIPTDGKLLSITVAPQRWVEQACTVVSRSLTQDEWDRLVPGDEPRRSVCS